MVGKSPVAGALAVRLEVDGARGSADTIPVLVGPAHRRVLTLARIAETVVVVALEIVLQQILGPLFWPRRC